MLLNRTKTNIGVVIILAVTFGFILGKLRQKGFLESLSDIHFSIILGAVLGTLSVFIIKPKTKF